MAVHAPTCLAKNCAAAVDRLVNYSSSIHIGPSYSDVGGASFATHKVAFFVLSSGPSGVTARAGAVAQEWAWAGGNQERDACVVAKAVTPDGSTPFGVRRTPIDRPKSVMQNSAPSTCYAGPGIPPPSLTDLFPRQGPKGSPALYSSPQHLLAGFSF